MKTIRELLSLSTVFLQEKGVFQPRRQAEELLAHALQLQRMDLYLQHDRPLEEAELDLFRQWIQRKAKHEPTEYILEKIDFYHCTFQLNSSALIPRPETEILVDLISRRFREIDVSGRVLWDVCCGSGCIGISLKKAFPALTVVLSDLSSEVLSLAACNARLNGVEVTLRKGDLLKPFQGEKADYITCNPPYISQKEYAALDRSVRTFEPQIALIGGERGTEMYERLAEELPSYLKEKGQVFFEIGAAQGSALKEIFSLPWARFSLNQDWSGRDRFFFLEKQ
ncbi:MAG: peptide chain release factor N(5)-glutamine methyltransferase [Chlamydiales bacterium]|nr:peptide chain release factor N(5)-glutamine methyltransferase [Chlamydiales bacterium]